MSDLGRIRRIARRSDCIRIKPPIHRLNKLFLARGYRYADLWRNNQEKKLSVHRIVMAAFVGPRPTGYDINHKDGIKTNNRISNLEYVTRAENLAHAARTGLDDINRMRDWQRLHPELIPSGSKNGQARFSNETGLLILSLLRAGATPVDIAHRFNISKGTAREIKYGRHWVNRLLE